MTDERRRAAPGDADLTVELHALAPHLRELGGDEHQGDAFAATDRFERFVPESGVGESLGIEARGGEVPLRITGSEQPGDQSDAGQLLLTLEIGGQQGLKLGLGRGWFHQLDAGQRRQRANEQRNETSNAQMVRLHADPP